MKMKTKARALQHGFSLIELMIAMGLGLFIMAGIATVYISSKETYALRDQISEMDESARVAMKALRTHIERAGYSSDAHSQLDNYLLPSGLVPSSVLCPTGQANIINVARIATSADGSSIGASTLTTNQIMARSDTIGLSFLADDSLMEDCTGGSWKKRCMINPNESMRTAANQGANAQLARRVYSSFRIQKNASRENNAGDGIPELVCGGSLNTYSQPWAQGIENLQLRYGVDNLPITIPAGQKKQWQVDQYWTATQVTANNAWDKVALVQVALLVRTMEPVFKQAEAKNYQLFDQSIATNDRYKRAVYTTTIYLRNIAR